MSSGYGNNRVKRVIRDANELNYLLENPKAAIISR